MAKTEMSVSGSGWMSFASVMMLVYAVVLIVSGFAGIFNTDLFFRGDVQDLLLFNYTAWGWIHLVMGVIFVATGVGLMRNMDWAVLSAVLLIILALLVHLITIVAFPTWSAVFLFFDALLLYALMVSGGKAKVVS